MGADEIPGLMAGDTVQVQPVKQTMFTEFAVVDPQPLPDGGSQLAFIVPATREVFVFPMNPQAAEKLGKQLVAPRVALPDGAGPNGLHAV